MVEHQIVCKILQSQNLRILQEFGITVEEFPPDYQAEIQFILDHKNKYGVVPDPLTFMATFEGFQMVDVNEPDSFLVDALLEKHLHSRQMLLANAWGEKLGNPDSREAFTYLLQEAEKLRKIQLKRKTGKNIVKDVTRHAQYVQRIGLDGVIGLDTGIDELTKVTKGWLGEDFVVILARTNEGKSWLLLYFLYVAWKNGIPVLLYSGEMGHDVVGYRFDTIAGNFSNDALMSGLENVGGDTHRPKSEYDEFINNLGTIDVPFIVITPKDLGSRLDIPTLHFLIEAYQPGIVGIDQLSLMKDYRASRGEQLRMQYTHIAEDLYDTSEKYKIPILAPAQANRGAEGNKKEDAERKAPFVEDISESDGIGQNSTRVVAMAVNGVTLTLNVRKNRYGKKNQEVKLLWDIDKGIMKPFNTPSNERPEVEEGETPLPATTSGEELF